MPDKRYLERRNGRNVWHVVLDVPEDVRGQLGRKLRRSTGTSSLREAQTVRWQVIPEFKRQIQEARGFGQGVVVAEAKRLLDQPPRYSDGEIAQEVISDRIEYVQAYHGDETAARFAGIAQGTSTPMRDLIDPWLQESSMTDKTRDLYRAPVLKFIEWAGDGVAIQEVTRKMAGNYVSNVMIPSGRAPKTINRDISALSGLWNYAYRRGHIEGDNPWKGQIVPEKTSKRGKDTDDCERPFSIPQVRLLLDNAPDQTLYDLILLGALTGCRIEELAQIKVRDINSDCLTIRHGKNQSAIRQVPIHANLIGLVQRRKCDKSPNTYFLEELKMGTYSRSGAVGKRFKTFRERLGLKDHPNQERRSLLNFHSLRRFFITEAERAGVEPWVLAAVVGHARQGMTLGTYSAGPSEAQKRAVVNAVPSPTSS